MTKAIMSGTFHQKYNQKKIISITQGEWEVVHVSLGKTNRFLIFVFINAFDKSLSQIIKNGFFQDINLRYFLNKEQHKFNPIFIYIYSFDWHFI